MWEAEADGLLVPCQPGVHRNTVSKGRGEEEKGVQTEDGRGGERGADRGGPDKESKDKEKQAEEERGKAESPPPSFGFRSVPFVSSG